MARYFTTANLDYYSTDTLPVSAAPLSMAAWVRPATNATQSILSLSDTATTTDQFGLFQNSGLLDNAGLGWYPAVLYRSTEEGGWRSVSASAAMTQDTWHHVLGVIASDSDKTVYLDGGNAGNDARTTSLPDSIDSFEIGRWGDSSPNWEFDGAEGEVAIWDVALTAAEAAILAAGYSPLFVRPQNLVAYYPLNGSGATENDLKGGIATGQATTGDGPDPYAHPRIIMPTAQILQFPPTVAAPGGFQAAWARNANNIIGMTL